MSGCCTDHVNTSLSFVFPGHEGWQPQVKTSLCNCSIRNMFSFKTTLSDQIHRNELNVRLFSSLLVLVLLIKLIKDVFNCWCF